MEFFQKNRQFSFLGYGASSSRGVSKNKSAFVLGVIVLVHAFIILLFINEYVKSSSPVFERTLRAVHLLPTPIQKESIKDEADSKASPELQLRAPQVDVPESVIKPLNIPSNEAVNVFSSEDQHQYSGVFDPKMRKKLTDSQALNRPRAQEKSSTWTAIDGRTYIEMGDGICMVSMAKVDSRDRATNWSYTTCGKNDSEKAMDRVMADFESRKAPLGKLKSSP